MFNLRFGNCGSPGMAGAGELPATESIQKAMDDDP
jgi:hypothetical protein